MCLQVVKHYVQRYQRKYSLPKITGQNVPKIPKELGQIEHNLLDIVGHSLLEIVGHNLLT